MVSAPKHTELDAMPDPLVPTCLFLYFIGMEGRINRVLKNPYWGFERVYG